MLRDILAGVAGIIIAVAIVFLADTLSHMLYPLPADLDGNDLEALRDHIETLPSGAFLMVMGGWVVATFVGAVVVPPIVIGPNDVHSVTGVSVVLMTVFWAFTP